MASKQSESPISTVAIVNPKENCIELDPNFTNEATTRSTTCKTETKSNSPMKDPPGSEKSVTKEKPDQELPESTEGLTTTDSNPDGSDCDLSDQSTQVLLFEGAASVAAETQSSSASRKVRIPHGSYEFGAAKRPEKPLGLLSGGTFSGDPNDDTDQFWQCENCPTRSRKNLSHCAGCSMPKDNGIPKKKQRKIKSPYGFELKYFFGGPLPAPPSPKN